MRINKIGIAALLLSCISLSGCVAAAVGAGAAGGYYFDNNYKVKVSKKHHTAKASKSQTGSTEQ
jgi:hypothetical protein